jgi:hypothetical protein
MDLFSLTFWGEKGRNSWVLDRDRGTGQEKRQRFNTEITERSTEGTETSRIIRGAFLSNWGEWKNSARLQAGTVAGWR